MAKTGNKTTSVSPYVYSRVKVDSRVMTAAAKKTYKETEKRNTLSLAY